ncbi:MAG: transcription termination/antitermination protein NusA [Caldilineaceae bacterium]|nr:transcription termination/antitermination protein NusA [Caldilineaceae bacterium]MBP8106754.1 transcription termination/antitermination protein NusA [Caldilineaceae bacterium]MBP8123375.1 transcription termination/antitermination protein NusA [Caldilineaceae bacterium]MBP9073418.1 transcription termination/antitermination protein NusA [Caldilineaceae bacterium]
MSKALIAGINQVATDKGLDREIIFEAIEAALISAYKRNYGSVANVSAGVDRISGDMRVYAEKEVVEGVMNPRTEIDIVEAKKLNPSVVAHDLIKIPSTPGNFGRIAAQTAKQVILQRIREAERDTVYENYVHRVGELINAQVRSIDTLSGTVTVLLDDKHESLLPRDEQIPNERLRRSDYIKLFVVDVQKGSRGPMIKLSRTHRNLLRRLMEQEIPEVREGTVEIKNIAREPGARSKVAVVSTVAGVDSVGSCVGQRGMRIQGIVNELAGEKIDVVEWNSEIRTYISNALSPAQVDVVILEGDNNVKTATVVVPDRQLSLAIGKAGQNARLAAKLTGWRIDIKSESEALVEGYDLDAAKQIQTSAGKGDLLTRAQTFLDANAKVARAGTGPDKLGQIARMVEDEGDELPPVDMSMFGDLPPTPDQPKVDMWGATKKEPVQDSPKPVDPFGQLAAQLAEEEARLRKITESLDVAGKTPATPPTPPTPVVGEPEDLPEVITADMLRARRSKKVDMDDMKFEIPAELLVGLLDESDDDEIEELEDIFEEESDRNKGKSKRGKTVKPAKKVSKKKRRPAYGDDDYDDYI